MEIQENFAKNTRQRDNERLFEAHRRAQKNRNAQNTVRRVRQIRGFVRLRNTDSIARATRIRTQLVAKLREVFAAPIDMNLRKALSRTVTSEIENVDRMINQIRRRKRAVREEQRAQNNNDPAARRRRRNDMAARSITVRRDLLYSTNRGGFDPRKFSVHTMKKRPGQIPFLDGVAVICEIQGVAAEINSPPADTGSLGEIFV